MSSGMPTTYIDAAKSGALASIIPGKLPSESGIKRALDLVLGFSALCILALPMGIIAWRLKRADGGPAIFCQTRCSAHGQTFNCLKFRTMVVDAETRLEEYLKANPEAAAEWARDHKLRNDPRITRLGKFLRRTSLDELPQLWNVLRGQMSIVGPRPIVAAEISKYGDDFIFYSATRPGLTGSWQVNGRNDTTYDERVQMDVDYVRSWSLWLDIKIIAATVPAVLARRGAF